MDMMDFFKMMGLSNDTYFKKSEHCFCVFASIHLKGDGFDKVVGSSIPYLCEECFGKISEKEFEKRIQDFEGIVMNIPKKKFIKSEEELNTYFMNHSLNKTKMEENSKKYSDKLNYLEVDSVHFDGNTQNPSIILNLEEQKKK
jgi:hypothetical protein